VHTQPENIITPTPAVSVRLAPDTTLESALQNLQLDSQHAVAASNITPQINPSAAKEGKAGRKEERGEREDQEKYRLILEKKKDTSLDDLCGGFPGIVLHTLFVFVLSFLPYWSSSELIVSYLLSQ
jgi:hypothetical protein